MFSSSSDSYNPHSRLNDAGRCVQGTAGNAAYATLLNVASGQGTLVSIANRIGSGGETYVMKVTIDGNVRATDIIIAPGASAAGDAAVLLNWMFGVSCLVEIKCSGAPTANITRIFYNLEP